MFTVRLSLNSSISALQRKEVLGHIKSKMVFLFDSDMKEKDHFLVEFTMNSIEEIDELKSFLHENEKDLGLWKLYWTSENVA